MSISRLHSLLPLLTMALIGELLRESGSEDLVVVVSDHGSEARVAMGVLTGDHKSEKAIDGVIFARGFGIPAGAPAGPITINDVTPTILAWLGLPVAEDMDGHPAGFLDVPEVGRIPTYDVALVERLDLTPSGVEETILEQLRGLGYLE
jgi:hypothetical protein